MLQGGLSSVYLRSVRDMREADSCCISGLVSAFGMLTLMKQHQHVCGWHKMVPRPVATLTRFPGNSVKVTEIAGGPSF